MALPSTHLFLMRNIIHHHNMYRNEQRLGNIKRAFGNVTMNRHSQAVLVNTVSPEKASTVPMDIDVPTEPVPKPSALTVPKYFWFRVISLAFNYCLGHTTVMNSVHMVCAAIEKVMMQKFLPRPTADSWKEVAQLFCDKWNFPNCLGALEGKH